MEPPLTLPDVEQQFERHGSRLNIEPPSDIEHPPRGQPRPGSETASPRPGRAASAFAGSTQNAIGVSSFAGIFFDPQSDNFGLKALLTTIALFASGIVLVAIGPARYRAASSSSFWREFFAVREVTVALDVLTVLGCAALVVAASQLWA